MEATISKHTNHIFRQLLPCCYQNSGSSHGNTGKNDSNILTKMFQDKIDPDQTVPMLLNPKGNHTAFTASGTSLIHDQSTVSQCESAFYSTG